MATVTPFGMTKGIIGMRHPGAENHLYFKDAETEGCIECSVCLGTEEFKMVVRAGWARDIPTVAESHAHRVSEGVPFHS